MKGTRYGLITLGKLSIAGPSGAEQNEIEYADSNISMITDGLITWSELFSELEAM